MGVLPVLAPSVVRRSARKRRTSSGCTYHRYVFGEWSRIAYWYSSHACRTCMALTPVVSQTAVVGHPLVAVVSGCRRARNHEGVGQLRPPKPRVAGSIHVPPAPINPLFN